MITTKSLFKTYTLKTWRKNKSQIFLSIFSIAVSATILLSIQLMLSLNSSYINSNAINANEGDINISLFNQSLNKEQLNKLNDFKSKGYLDYTTSYKLMNKIIYGDVSSTVFLKFVDLNHYPIEDKGYNYKSRLQNNGVVISNLVADKFNLKKGDTISLNIQGFSNDIKFKISDIVETNVPDESVVGVIVIDKSILLNSRYNKLSNSNANGGENLVSNINIKINKKYTLEDIQKKLSETFQGKGKISTYKDVINNSRQVLDKETKGLNLIEVFVIIISGVGISVTVILLNLKRKKDYLILNIYGMNENLLKKLIIYETYIVTIIGDIFGVVLSFIIIGLAEKSIMKEMSSLSIISSSWLQIISTVIFIIAETFIFTLLSIEITKEINPSSILRQQKQGSEFIKDLYSPFLKIIILLTISFSLYIKSFYMGGMYISLLIIFISIIFVIVYFLINQLIKINVSKNKHLMLSIRNLRRQKFKISIISTALATIVILCGIIINLCYGIIPSIMNQYVNNNGYGVILKTSFQNESETEKVLNQDKNIIRYIKTASSNSKLISVNNNGFQNILNNMNFNSDVKRNTLNTFSNLNVEAIDLSNTMLNYSVIKGRWFTSEDKNNNYVVLGNKFTDIGINLNDEIQIQIKGKTLKFKVIGIMGRNIVNGDDNLYIGINSLKASDLLNDNNSNLQYLIKTYKDNGKQVTFNLNKELKQAQVISMIDALKQLEEYLQKLAFIFILICCISIFAAICLIVNILMIINYERIKEFLVLSVLGAKDKDIRKIIIIEGFIIGGISGVFAALINEIISCFIMNNIFYSRYYPNIFIIISIIFGTITISVISCLSVIDNMKIKNYIDMFRID